MAQAPAKENKYLPDFRSLERSVTPSEPEWVGKMRHRAFVRFAEQGFPTARRGNEKWKYTSVAPIANAAFKYTLDRNGHVISPGDLHRHVPWHDSWVNLVFVDGHYCQSLSTPLADYNCGRVTTLSEAMVTDGQLAEQHLAQYATFEDDAFTALNTAFLRDGAFVHVPEDNALGSPLHLLYLTTSAAQPTVSHPRTLIVAGRHSKLTVIESYAGLSPSSNFTNAVTEIVVGDGAEIEHYRLLMDGPQSFHVGTTRVSQGQDSVFSSGSFATGASLARNDLLVWLNAPGSSCFLNGLYMTADNQHIDNYINVYHVKPHTTSRLNYKGILDGKSRAVFGGTVMVRPDAQKADSQQSDKNLVLTEDAEVNSKPSLLIYADDVKCSHGATAGNVDEDTIFYMRSRGLDQETATRLVVHGFATEIINTVRPDPLRDYLDRTLANALPNPRFREMS